MATTQPYPAGAESSDTGSHPARKGAHRDLTAAMAAENFPVALRVLPGDLRRHLTATYRFARHVDDLGDEYDGPRVTRLGEVVEDLEVLYGGGTPDDPVVGALKPTVREHRVPSAAWRRLVEANLQDQTTTRYQSFEDLLGYCRLSANPVGEIVLHILGCATADRVALSDRVCTALQLLEHWQDIAEDYRRGRVYLPREDMQRFGVCEEDLGRDTAVPPLCALVGFETDRAVAWLGAGAPLVSTLHGWGRLAVSGYVAGGRAAARELRRCGHDPLPRPPKPTKRGIAAAWLEATVRWPG